MSFMNQFDIEAAYHNRHECPNVRKATRLLYSLMRAVNAQSDGWAYWHAPSQSCRQLFELLDSLVVDWTWGTRGAITDEQLRKAITPIRSMVTRQKKQQAKYGNTFEFDVDAALKEPELSCS